DPADNVRVIVEELHKFSSTLAQRERWLLLNKIDLLPPDEVEERCQQLVDKLGWTGPVFRLSALNREGTDVIAGRAMDHLEAIWTEERENPEAKEREQQLQQQMAQEARDKIEALREAWRAAKLARGEDDDFDDDDYDVEVEYVRY